MVFCDEIKNPQTVTFFKQIKSIFSFFFTHLGACKLFLVNYNTVFGTIWTISISQNKLETLPAFFFNFNNILDNGYMYQKSILPVP